MFYRHTSCGLKLCLNKTRMHKNPLLWPVCFCFKLGLILIAFSFLDQKLVSTCGKLQTGISQMCLFVVRGGKKSTNGRSYSFKSHANTYKYFYIVILEVNPVCVCIQRTEMGQVRAGACCEGVGTCLMPPVNLCSHHLLSLWLSDRSRFTLQAHLSPCPSFLFSLWGAEWQRGEHSGSFHDSSCQSILSITLADRQPSSALFLFPLWESLTLTTAAVLMQILISLHNLHMSCIL